MSKLISVSAEINRNALSGKFPFRRESVGKLPQNNRYPTSIIHDIRRKDDLARAPFSDRTLIVLDSDLYELPLGYREHAGTCEALMNVPVERIIGVGSRSTALIQESPLREYGYVDGMTFREVLFSALHGGGMTHASLNFLTDTETDKTEVMPHEPDPKFPNDTTSYKGIILMKRGDWFFIDNGKQRAVVAMYALFQLQGPGALLHKVRVSGLSQEEADANGGNLIPGRHV